MIPSASVMISVKVCNWQLERNWLVLLWKMDYQNARWFFDSQGADETQIKSSFSKSCRAKSVCMSSKNYLKRCGTRKNEILHQKLHLHNLFNSSKKDFNTTKNTRRTLIKNTTQKSQFGYLSSENFWSKFYTEKSLV